MEGVDIQPLAHMTYADALNNLRQALEAEQMYAALGALRETIQAPFNVLQLQRLNTLLRTHELKWRNFLTQGEVRIAILGSYTTQPVREAVSVMLVEAGLWPVVYEADYNSIDTGMLSPDSGLFAFKPDIVFLATGWQSLRTLPPVGSNDSEVQGCLDTTLRIWQCRWAVIHEHTNARIIQHSFDLPPSLPLGRLEGRYSWSVTNFVSSLNRALWGQENARLRILDVSGLSMMHGTRQWFDARWFHHSKHGFSPVRIAEYTRALGGLLRAIYGRNRKCLVTDLDNTLWGGVIGDDGIHGIALGNGTALGEAYLAFGQFLKSLGQLGVILAVCSKNEDSIARGALMNHPESVLRPGDFASIVCNWRPKSENLHKIAVELNIGLDSLVFVDDNPAECDEVRRALPEVAVIEMSGDPSYFPHLIADQHFFTPLQFTEEDLARGQSYQASKAIREASSETTESLDAFLATLEMEARIARASSEDLARIEQLFGKTNQFNLTGVRFDEAELAERIESSDYLVLSARLTDRHANHGLVATLVTRREETRLVIVNWVMSCRVFSRCFEHLLLNHLQEQAQAMKCTTIFGRFISTPKNDYARRFIESVCDVSDKNELEFKYQRSVSAPALSHFIRS